MSNVSRAPVAAPDPARQSSPSTKQEHLLPSSRYADPRALVVRFAVVIVLIALDLWSKAAAFALMQRLESTNDLVADGCGSYHARLPLAGEWFSFMRSLNPGAAFGQFDSFPHLLVGGRVVAVLFLVWLIVRTPRGRPFLSAAFVLVLAGAAGNLYDNLLRERTLRLDAYYQGPYGPVRDFIDVYFDVWKWHFPTFNVADSCITVGAILLLALGIFHREEAGEREPSAPTSAPNA